jgi:hypothetical protein
VSEHVVRGRATQPTRAQPSHAGAGQALPRNTDKTDATEQVEIASLRSQGRLKANSESVSEGKANSETVSC